MHACVATSVFCAAAGHAVQPLSELPLAAGWRLTERARAGYGTCFPPVQRGEFYDVRCVGPEELLKPGQVRRLAGSLAELARWGYRSLHTVRHSSARQVAETCVGPALDTCVQAVKTPAFCTICGALYALTSVLTSTLADVFASRAQIKNAMTLLASPYLHNGLAVVVNQTSQLINAAGRPVPLSEVRLLLQEGLLVACSL